MDTYKVTQGGGVRDSNDIEEIVRDIGTNPLEDETYSPDHDGEEDIFIDTIDQLSNIIDGMS